MDGGFIDGIPLRTIGPAAMSGRIVDLAVVETDPTVFYVASATGGVWKTVDGGVTYGPVFQNQGTHSVGAIAVHPVDTATVWVGTGERASRQSSSWGDGVYRSVDGGETWANMGLADSKHVGRIALHPVDPDVVYVAAMGHLWGPNEERGVYRSDDGGVSWARILGVDENTGAVDVALDPENPSIVYAATYQRRRRPYGFHGGGPGSGLWKSTDGGDSWTRLTNGGLENGLPEGEMGRIGISIHRADPRIVYVSIEQGERYNASTAYEQRAAGVYRSEDRGETWEHMSDWNPRPMYASQILVDPGDDQRVYMVNTYSFSNDGGRSWTTPRQSLHGDDRLVWVNPADSRHVMKADDGGLGISLDRGLTWLYARNLPVSQFYRVGVDLRDPYTVCGGLQDNGSWCGPSATYRSEGILNEDWRKWGGGDGFRNVIDTTDNRTLYNESQYLGLQRIDLESGQSKTIRPGAPEGFIGARRNWTTWPDLQDPVQRLGNAMPPGNWDGPFIVSPHDADRLYAGLDRLYVSEDRGESWTDLGDLTTGRDRRELEIMGERPDSFILSLDDGIPYYPTLTEIAESPLREGLLWVGTDDGNVWIVHPSGRRQELSRRVPGLPEHAWINGLEPSRFEEGRVYLAANDYRNDDYANHLWVSEDYGQTWMDLAGDLPAERVVRSVREDPRNPEVLWLGTEMGLFWSPDRGGSWHEIRGGMPLVAVNDLVVHPRDNDLIVGTHGRGIWILDDVNAFQEWRQTTDRGRAPLALFSMEPARQIRYERRGGHTGDMHFAGDNPPAGAPIDFWVGEGASRGDLALTILDAGSGEEVARIPLRRAAEPGLNRVVWNLRLSMGTALEDRRGPLGPLVVPGDYRVVLSDGGTSAEQLLEVREDPRIQVEPSVRRAWTETLVELHRLQLRADSAASRLDASVDAVDEGEVEVDAATADEARDLLRELRELRSRITRLRSGLEDWVGPPTEDEASRKRFLEETLTVLLGELEALAPSLEGHGG
jgi:photosystem II stability/assembly factor-like uncharacterized protein